jgi:hypothetical protein
VASNSTRSPDSSVFSPGSQTTVSPLVWPRPSCSSCTSSLPSHSVIFPVKVIVGQVIPGGTLSTFCEQAREAADLARLVGLATLDDQVVGVLAGDDLLRLVGARAEHAHRVVVRQHDVPDRLVGHLADAADHVGGHRRRGLRVGHQHASSPMMMPVFGSPSAV